MAKETGPAPEELELQTTTSLDEKGRIKEPQPEGTVRFNPQMATIRKISQNEWPMDARPKEGSQDAVWDASNGYQLPTKGFTPRQLQVLREDGHFTVVD
jgi:hypothetical protein